MCKEFKVIVTGHNTEKWSEKCIKSIKNQTYKNFKCIVIDDASHDSSFNIIESIVSDDNRFQIIKNKDRVFALQNIITGINVLECNDEDIIIQIDGDDWLYADDVFEYINSVYEKDNNVWMTYGQFVFYPKMEKGWCQRFFEEIIEKKIYRENIWICSQLRTFKYFLWKNIKDQDLCDKNGLYYRIVWDLAIMFPMLEMCESKNIFSVVDKILYVYNTDNPANDFKHCISEIREIELEIRKKEKYKTLMRI